jgi:hypothetical protein
MQAGIELVMPFMRIDMVVRNVGYLMWALLVPAMRIHVQKHSCRTAQLDRTGVPERRTD